MENFNNFFQLNLLNNELISKEIYYIIFLIKLL